MDSQTVSTVVMIAGAFFTAVVYVIRLALAPSKQSIDNLSEKITDMGKRYDNQNDVLTALSTLVQNHEKALDKLDDRVVDAHQRIDGHDERLKLIENERGRFQ